MDLIISSGRGPSSLHGAAMSRSRSAGTVGLLACCQLCFPASLHFPSIRMPKKSAAKAPVTSSPPVSGTSQAETVAAADSGGLQPGQSGSGGSSPSGAPSGPLPGAPPVAAASAGPVAAATESSPAAATAARPSPRVVAAEQEAQSAAAPSPPQSMPEQHFMDLGADADDAVAPAQPADGSPAVVPEAGADISADSPPPTSPSPEGDLNANILKALGKALTSAASQVKSARSADVDPLWKRLRSIDFSDADPSLLPQNILSEIDYDSSKLLEEEIWKFHPDSTGELEKGMIGFVRCLWGWFFNAIIAGVSAGDAWSHVGHCLAAASFKCPLSGQLGGSMAAERYDLQVRKEVSQSMKNAGCSLRSACRAFSSFDSSKLILILGSLSGRKGSANSGYRQGGNSSGGSNWYGGYSGSSGGSNWYGGNSGSSGGSNWYGGNSGWSRTSKRRRDKDDQEETWKKVAGKWVKVSDKDDKADKRQKKDVA
ncbi:hypothetical protein FOZ63_033244 [Perkinsus olseni]|uniref:Uncharacterized protein n=2 Tax=Perkinsus olseni TaxID=32597 RepID=A0A7J6TEV2_PEROL|nr:hypothetical protein FOZ63_033244 [Perkinsus olseni]